MRRDIWGGSEVLVLGTITNNTYQVITEGDEPIAPILSSDSRRGGGVAVVMCYESVVDNESTKYRQRANAQCKYDVDNESFRLYARCSSNNDNGGQSCGGTDSNE